MAGAPTRKHHDKQSVKLPVRMVTEMRAEAARLGKPLSWVAQQAWKRARQRIRNMRGPDDG